jgi:hypothetical protein
VQLILSALALVDEANRGSSHISGHSGGSSSSHEDVRASVCEQDRIAVRQVED